MVEQNKYTVTFTFFTSVTRQKQLFYDSVSIILPDYSTDNIIGAQFKMRPATSDTDSDLSDITVTYKRLFPFHR